MPTRAAFLPAVAVACCAFFVTACTTPPSQPAAPKSAVVSESDANFRRHVDAVLEDMWKTFPEHAINAGNYKYAGQLTVHDAARRAEVLAFCDRHLAALARFDPASLDASNRVDHGLIKNRFESRRWYLTTFKDWQWQPSYYNVGNSFGVILNTEFAPIDARLRLVSARLEKVPAYYAVAQANIADPTLEYTTLALVQNRGTLRIFGEDLQAKVAASGLTADEKALFTKRMAAARTAIGDYLAYLGALETKLKAGPARGFRIGKALYDQKFAHDIQSGFTVDALHKRAIAEKAALHDAMEAKARELWPRVMAGKPMPADRLVMIRAVLDQLSLRHTTRDKFVETIRAQIPALEKFVREKDLMDQDATRPLAVRETPLYMRGGGAGASVSAPGPFDPKATTYYNVTPLDGLTDEQAESYLREYNDWTLQILNIHEAIPGHYLQLVHANKSPSPVKSVFGNGAMIEGWAVFSEKVMLDAGYDNGSAEIWLFWMKWNLRSVVNTILDIEIQTMGLERDAAITMMTREAFQQQEEASKKWLRATLSQVQLTSYYNGYAEITALRDELRAKQGAKFSVKAFNNQFLSYGSAPVREIAKLMK